MSRAKISMLPWVALGLSLSACGGGGSSGGSGPITTPPPPTTPTTPPAPPSTANADLLSIAQSEDFTNDSATITANFPASGSGQTASAAASSLNIIYDAAVKSYTIKVAGRNITFTDADRSAADSTATLTVYKKTSGSQTDTFTLTKAGTSGRFTFQYVGGGYWQRTNQTSSAISGNFDAVAYGVETPNGAVPRSGRAEYAIDLIGLQTETNNVAGVIGEGLMQVDFSTGVIVTHGTFTPATTKGSFSSEARLSSGSNEYSGIFRFDNGNLATGHLRGRFYGPNAQETGGVFDARFPDGNVVAGTILGRGSSVTATNSDFNSLAVNQFFAANSAVMDAVLQGQTGFNTGSESFLSRNAGDGALIVNYNAGIGAYTVIAPTRSQFFPQSASTDRYSERLESTTPVNGANDFYSSGLQNLRYARSSRWTRLMPQSGQISYSLEDFIYGFRTPDIVLPRTGDASYAIGLRGMVADSSLPNFALLNGYGALQANFLSGTIRAEGQLLWTEDFITTQRIAKKGGGYFSASGNLSSNANSFAGTMNLDLFGGYSGTMAGGFFGPNAEEVAAVWKASSANGGAATGTFVGGRDDSLRSDARGITELPQPTDLTYFEDQSSIRNGSIQKITYDPSAQTYSVELLDEHLSNAAPYILRYGPNNLVTGSSDASFDAFTVNGQSISGQPIVYSVHQLKLNKSNPTLALTYASLAEIKTNLNTGSGTNNDRNYVAFGISTPVYQVPRGGSGTFEGVALGSGTREIRSAYGSNVEQYDLSGTFVFNADFANSSFASILNLNGKNLSSGADYAFKTYDFTGAISGNKFSTADNSRTFAGGFFGPNAAELGGQFQVLDNVLINPDDYYNSSNVLSNLYGAFAGKKK